LQTNLEIRVDLPSLISCDLVGEDLRNKRYYYWTEHNRRMRMVDMSKLNVEDSKVQAIPLDEVRQEDILDRTQDFSA